MHNYPMTMFGIHLFPLPKMFGFMFHVSRHMFSHHPPSNLHINELISCLFKCVHTMIDVIIANRSQTHLVLWVVIFFKNDNNNYNLIKGWAILWCLLPSRYLGVCTQHIDIDVVTWHGQSSVLDALLCQLCIHLIKRGCQWLYRRRSYMCGRKTPCIKCNLYIYNLGRKRCQYKVSYLFINTSCANPNVIKLCV